jgi:serine/threonine protein kinase
MKSTGDDVAIKIIEKKDCNEQDLLRINGEINHLYKFNHVTNRIERCRYARYVCRSFVFQMNILKLQAYFERNNAVYLVTERMETDMCQYINTSRQGYLNEHVSRMLIYQVIVALRYLHGNDCGHLDVKCENILLTLLKPCSSSGHVDEPSMDYPLVKLADFGYARIIGEHSFRKTRVGTVGINETCTMSPVDLSIDVFLIRNIESLQCA